MITAVTVRASRKAERKAPANEKSREMWIFDCTRTRMRVKVKRRKSFMK